jgi:uncharacterized repeat protein (TIGR03803 family)
MRSKPFTQWNLSNLRRVCFWLPLLISAATFPAFAQSITPTLYRPFSTPNGGWPDSGQFQASDGNFYGTTSWYGTLGVGTIFKFTPSGEYTVIHTLNDPTDGAYPVASLTEGPDGNLYGVTSRDGEYGVSGWGTVFRITLPDYVFSVLHYFSGELDGAFPGATLTLGSDGNFYGTTSDGGINAEGTAYKITPAGVLTPLYQFCIQLDCSDGMVPAAPLLEGSDGNFYGTTIQGGQPIDNGSVFKLTPSGTLTTLHSFADPTTAGIDPTAAQLFETADGSFLGTTSGDGPVGATGGTLYKITPSGNLSVVHAFIPDTDGANPNGVIEGTDGNYYGTAYSGGPEQYSVYSGTIFSINPAGNTNFVYYFNNKSVASPEGELIQDSNGNFWGTTHDNGPHNYGYGTIFKFQSPTGPSIPITLSLSQSVIEPNQTVELNWSVANANSLTSQQCYAFIQNGAITAGIWTGKQMGTHSSTTHAYSGSASITPTATGTYTYALTCAGTQSGFATLKVAYPSVTALSAKPATATVGENMTLTATVTESTGPAKPTGSVTFYAGTIPIETIPLNNSGVATLTASTNGIIPASYPITATYSGDSNYYASTSPLVTVRVNPAPTKTTLAASPSSVNPPASVTLTAATARSTAGAQGVPSGTITFSIANVTLGTAQLNGLGVATFTSSSNGIKAGSYPVRATYSGDVSDSGSTSNAVTVSVE